MLKPIAYFLLVVLNLHALSIHSFAESLVYCFEANGDVNVESTVDLGLGMSSETDVHTKESHAEGESVFHQENDAHKDVAVTLLCSKDDRVNRFNQKKVVTNLKNFVYRNSEISAPSRFIQKHTFIPPDIEDQETANLQTVVLLN